MSASPAAGWPSGTRSVSADHRATALAGALGQGTPTTGSGSAATTGWVNRDPPFKGFAPAPVLPLIRCLARWHRKIFTRSASTGEPTVVQLRAGLSAQDPLDNYH